MGHMGHMTAEDRAALLDARIAGVKAGLRLTADQEKLWGPLESAVRDGMKRGEDMRAQLADKGRPSDPIEGLARMADASTVRGEVLHKIVDAARPLYASLTDDQKRRLDILMHRGGHEGWRERMGERMRHWREWGEEHMGRGRQGALEPQEPALFRHTSGAFGDESFISRPRLNNPQL
jgi:zinc resistance-associated protein